RPRGLRAGRPVLRSGHGGALRRRRPGCAVGAGTGTRAGGRMTRFPVPVVPAPVAARADHDDELIRLWLHGRPATTPRAYAGDVERFRAAVARPLASITLGELQGYADSLAELAPATQARQLSAVKSLFAFGHRIGVLPANVGAALRLPRLRDRLAKRILAEPSVQRLLALEPD